MTLEKLKMLCPYGNMTVRQLAMLVLLNCESLKLRDAAMKLHISRAAATRAWDGLCREKLMKRTRSEDDRRDVYGGLTDKGIKLVGELE